MSRLLIRLLVGALFVGHGTQKLFGAFGGEGPDGTGKMFESVGLKPGRANAIAAGTAETTGGALLAAGLATPAAVASLSAVMLTAIRTVHWPNGPWSSNGGYEYNAVLLATLFGVAEHGPGPLSLDAALGIERSGTRFAIAALAAGAVASTAAVARGRRYEPADAVVTTSPSDPAEALVGVA